MPDDRFSVPSVEATPVLLRDESNVCVVLGYSTKTQRECILLRYRSRLSYKEISEKYHCTRQGVHNSVAGGIRKIKADCLFMDYIRGERDRPWGSWK